MGGRDHEGNKGRVTVSVSVTVPGDFLIYDLGTEQFVCRGCGKRDAWSYDAPATRGGGPSTVARIRNFMGSHARCCMDQQRRNASAAAASRLCGQEYTPPGGGGPFDCNLPEGHDGSCDSTAERSGG